MQNYGVVDLVIFNGLCFLEMVVWSDSLFDQSWMFWNEVCDWGFCVGVILLICVLNNLFSVFFVVCDQQNIFSFECEEICLWLCCMIELLIQKLIDLEYLMLMFNLVCLSYCECEIL